MIISINKNRLQELYSEKCMSINQIAKLYGVTYETIRHRMIKFGIPRRTKSEAMIKHPKRDFSGKKEEMAYMLGLRTGDVYACRHYNHIRVTTTTTRPSFVDMMRLTFGGYAHVGTHKRFNRNHYEWVVYADLTKSFEFLLEKPKQIPADIMVNDKLFFYFLAAYFDCEGSLVITKSNDNDVRFMFRVGGYEKTILEQLKTKLESLGLSPLLYLDRQKGFRTTFGRTREDFYVLKIYKKAAIIKLVKRLLPLSRHNEKITKIRFALELGDKKWREIKDSIFRVRADIKASSIK